MAMQLEFPDGELGDWACLGAVTDRAARVWLRAPGRDTAPVNLRCEDGRSVCADARPDSAHDGVAFLDLALEAPAPGCRFTVEAAGRQLEGRFAVAEGAPATFSFGFASCHQPFEPSVGGRVEKHAGAAIYAPMREALQAQDAQFLMLVGDQVYSDGVSGASVRDWAKERSEGEVTVEEFVDAYRHLYRGYFNERGFRELLEAFPSYLTWDDHDIMDSWGSRFLKSDEEERMFAAAARAYREYQWTHMPRGSFEGDPPYHYEFWRGDVGFFVLDLRGVRSWHDEVVLGSKQLAALAAFLRDADDREAGTVFLVSSIPLIHFSPRLVRILQWLPGGKGSDVRDRWDATPFVEERDRVIDLLGRWQQGASGRKAIVLSGDVHSGAAFRVHDRKTGAVFHQWTSSSLSAPGGWMHTLANRLGSRLVNHGERRCVAQRLGIEPRNNFGYVRVEARKGGGHDVRFALYARTERGVSQRFAVDAW